MVTSNNLPYSKTNKETRDENVVFCSFYKPFQIFKGINGIQCSDW